MSLRAALLEALYDPARLERLAAEDAVTFASRVIRDAGATWIPETADEGALLAAIEQYGWKRGGITPGCLFTAPDGTLGFIGKTSTDGTWFHGIIYQATKPHRQNVGGVRTWVPPG